MTLPPLSPAEFPAVFAAIHGVPSPFPWQARLVAQVVERGWPTALALPTGSGKTAAIDVALFHLALDADRGPDRRAPVRIAFVVDRRLIVDEAFERAERIAAALERAAGDGPLARMAARLRWLGCGGRPLEVARLRGGIPREDDWARTPAQPTVLCSTVDQVGSRLLFRGYGVSDGMKPVHAGLLGSDCLLLLDEAHLAAPFTQTLDRVGRLGRAAQDGEPRRWQVVGLSATPQGGSADPFRLLDDDHADPVLGPRLVAAKPAVLHRLELSAKEDPGPHADAFAKAVLGLLAERRSAGGGALRPLAVVVNRVALARAVFDAVRVRLAADEAAAGTDTILLTGRIRDLDRKALMDRHAERLRSGAEPADPPLIVVATQTIEAGADFDFDGLVTQIAPLDSLRQRFGRLNRLGRQGAATAVILAARDEVAAKADDAVYGDRARKTWDWLVSIAESPASAKAGGKGKAASVDPRVDFGIVAMDARVAAHGGVAELSAEKPDAPVLRPADVELLSWTAPIPHIDPELAPFLHGPKTGPADVQIVWRADIAPQTPPAAVGELLMLVPPHAGETLAVPIWAAKSWLARAGHGPATAVTDLEGVPDPQAGERIAGGRRAFRWAGLDTAAVYAGNLRPGDVIVVPATYGGCDDHGWKPASAERVSDLGDERPCPPRPVMRVHPELVADGLRDGLLALLGNQDLGDDELLDALKAKGIIEATEGWTVSRPSGYGGRILTGRRLKGRRSAVSATEDDESGTLTGDGIGLARHGEDVGVKAAAFAEAAGLSPARVADVALAARLHDEGKGDARFQAWLRGGDRLAATIASDTPLAKSARRMTGHESRAARRSAGLPDPWRHEVASVTRALADPRLAAAPDPELVLWLVGVHHGYGRPLFPHDDPREAPGQPGPQRPDFEFGGRDWPGLFTCLKERYGLWGLARLEAVLRLADHRASEDEEKDR
ncbi:type I-U CRISPR-associated helicase/endonuclease Cas3 [Azospirillum sp. TSO35-2]|uniref:type I-G CRISPR-associated helicase/endonuclease Cas3g n=1 Tax=Azospirillum sp. TSO35-2 TaxID=716796 RepID=UPI000D61FD63|nr:type I-U CRISPR-associated helicase/endonuclease Cas3 [Azospirillum sp. TSO35-2]PWC35926.1 hypothetical protein TSO352_11975 [Azospirillum sp. TSO35-2]